MATPITHGRAARRSTLHSSPQLRLAVSWRFLDEPAGAGGAEFGRAGRADRGHVHPQDAASRARGAEHLSVGAGPARRAGERALAAPAPQPTAAVTAAGRGRPRAGAG